MSTQSDTSAPTVRHTSASRLERHLARRSAAARKLTRYEADRVAYLADRREGMSR